MRIARGSGKSAVCLNFLLLREQTLVENVELVHRALQAVSLKHREVLTLRFLEDLSLEEIAQILACRLGTVKSRLHYAKQALRSKVEELSNE